MQLQFTNDAIKRVDTLLKTGAYDTDMPCEILADIIHYCNAKNIDFEEQVFLAQQYVSEELSCDAVSNDAQ